MRTIQTFSMDEETLDNLRYIIRRATERAARKGDKAPTVSAVIGAALNTTARMMRDEEARG